MHKKTHSLKRQIYFHLHNCITQILMTWGMNYISSKESWKEKSRLGCRDPRVQYSLYSSLSHTKKFFFELYRLCKIAVAIPVSTAACERSFSTLKLVKTYLRSTMNDDRLSNLGVLSIESRRAKALNLDLFVDQFARNHQNRRIQLL